MREPNQRDDSYLSIWVRIYTRSRYIYCPFGMARSYKHRSPEEYIRKHIYSMRKESGGRYQPDEFSFRSINNSELIDEVPSLSHSLPISELQQIGWLVMSPSFICYFSQKAREWMDFTYSQLILITIRVWRLIQRIVSWRGGFYRNKSRWHYCRSIKTQDNDGSACFVYVP